MPPNVRLDTFDKQLGFERGASAFKMAIWQLAKWAIYKTVFPWPSWMKVKLLRCFGAKIGRDVYLKPQINIHFPWKLEIGDHVWIGEEVFILNFEIVRIGAHACISQRAFLCGGNHDFRDPAMRYRNAPIVIEEGAWVGAQAFVAPGVTVGCETVVCAGSVLLQSAEPGRVYLGNPARPSGWRWAKAGDSRSAAGAPGAG